MLRTNVPAALRALRKRRRWRQHDLGVRAGLSRDPVSRLERGRLAGVTIGSLDALATAVGATLVVDLRWQGADLDRLIDRQHAALQETVARRLTRSGWMVRAEVSFNHYGDRGSCDLVAWHPREAIVLIVEVKSRLGNIQETLHRLDTKARLGHILAQQLGWPRPSSVARALVLREHGVTRRQLQRHASLFASYAIRGRSAVGWLQRPVAGHAALLWLQGSPDSAALRTVRGQRGQSSSRAG